MGWRALDPGDVTRLFNAIDVNRRGRVSFPDFQHALTLDGETDTSKSELVNIFADLDTNNSG